jgi:hypothetical protein
VCEGAKGALFDVGSSTSKSPFGQGELIRLPVKVRARFAAASGPIFVGPLFTQQQPKVPSRPADPRPRFRGARWYLKKCWSLLGSAAHHLAASRTRTYVRSSTLLACVYKSQSVEKG